MRYTHTLAAIKMDNTLTKNVLFLYGLLSIAVVCTTCNGIGEPITHGDYYITNNTMSKLFITAFGNFGTGEIELVANEINPGDKTYIFTFTEASGGHVMPSNAWNDFYVYAGIKSDSTIIYSGIENSDWEYEGTNSEDHLIYNLTIE